MSSNVRNALDQFDTGGVCRYCSSRLRRGGIEIYCPSCGNIEATDIVDRGPDWRDFSEGESSAHASATNRQHHDGGLGSHMGYGSDADAETGRLRTWHRRTRSDKKDRNHAYATTEITRMAAALDLPDTVRARARHLWQRLHREDLGGHDMDNLAPACLFVACREDGQGLAREDIAGVSHAEPRMVTRRALLVADRTTGELPPPDRRQRVRVVGTDAGATADEIDRALTLVERCDDGVLSGRDPSGVAAAVLYMAGDWTQDELSDAAGVCTKTIRDVRNAIRAAQ